MQSLLGARCVRHTECPRRDHPNWGIPSRSANSEQGDLMAAHQELSWPPVRTFMSAYKENLMAADKPDRRRPFME
jgi:hypothetical protein